MFVTVQELEQQMPDATVEEGKLRYFTPDGDLVPTPEEAAIAAQQQALEAQLQLEQEHQRAERLAEYLRSQGVDPDNLR
ncbi:hypothetical protein [Nostoc sp.]|uniref:hypothetical protein n=1 Tax=Nostoc sp. TaxID=1180 RepID=UPI002FF4C8B9